MNKKYMALLLLLIFLIGCSKVDIPPVTEDPVPPPITEVPIVPEKDPIEELIKDMSLDEKIGQLLIVGLDKTEISQAEIDQIKNNNVGGFIFFSRNIDNKNQVIALLNGLKDYNKDNKVPLFLSIDEEGGKVSRLSKIFSNLSDAVTLGDKNNKELSYEYGKIQGLKLSNLGFNINFAPVLDINSNPKNPVIGRRAIGPTAEVVSKQGVAVIEGLRSMNIIPAAKHFPGHGDTGVDSHLELPLVDKSYEELENLELIPFKAAIDNRVDMIMVAHILYPQIDDKNPSSISKNIIQGILRDKLGFNGVVISDDMTMGAITENYTLEEASVKFLQSGGDILLICHGIENPFLVIERIKKAITEDEISIEEIDEKIYRILELKSRFKIDNDKTLDTGIEDINSRVTELNNKLK